MQIVSCDETYAVQILAILNDAIVNSTALYDYQPRTMEMMAGWFAGKRKGNYPVIGAVERREISPQRHGDTENAQRSEDKKEGGGVGELVGFASYGGFRAWPAYKYSVEHSVYVAAGHRGKGIGRKLLGGIIEEARGQEYHVMVGVIDAANSVSIELHKKMGFVHAGRMREVGYKFGRWLDADFYELILETPVRPVDG